jgi:hypothetical protein
MKLMNVGNYWTQTKTVQSVTFLFSPHNAVNRLYLAQKHKHRTHRLGLGSEKNIFLTHPIWDGTNT